MGPHQITGGSHFDEAPSREIYIPTHRITHFLEDLASLADSWNALAVTYRLSPSGFWARVTNDDVSQNADCLESAATQLAAAIKRFQEGA